MLIRDHHAIMSMATFVMQTTTVRCTTKFAK